MPLGGNIPVGRMTVILGTVAGTLTFVVGTSHSLVTGLEIDSLNAVQQGGVGVARSKLFLPADGAYLTTMFGNVTGQSGSGNGLCQITRFNAANVQQAVIDNVNGVNLNTCFSGASGFVGNAGDYIEADFGLGATGTAGSIAWRFALISLNNN